MSEDNGNGNALGAAVAAGVASGVQTAGNIYTTNLTNKQNLELAKYQADRNLELWNLTNQYNSPAAQMARLARAGLNPNLVYGSGASSSTGNASPAPRFERPTFQAPQVDFGNLVGIFSMYQNLKAQEANTAKMEAQRNLIGADLLNKYLDNTFKSRTLEDRILYQANKTTNERYRGILYHDQHFLNAVRERQMEAAIKQSLANADNAEAQAISARANARYTNARTKWERIAPSNSPFWFRYAIDELGKGSLSNVGKNIGTKAKNFWQQSNDTNKKFWNAIKSGDWKAVKYYMIGR